MDEDRFWAFVDAARLEAGSNVTGRPDALRAQCRDLPPTELQLFQNHYDQQIARSYRWDICAAAKIIDGFVTDDSFRYFRDWLISEGRDTFEAAMRDPDTLADRAPFSISSLESFGYVILYLFEEKRAGDMDRDFSTEGAEPAGQDWEEKDLPTLLPRLWAKCQTHRSTIP